MPTNVTAGDGDTLCSIAVPNGFRNCRKVRDANPSLASRELRPGDVVTVPDPTPKEEPGQTEQLHKFIRHGSPPNRVFIIQDFNRTNPQQALSDMQRRLAITNYVPGRQGTGFATQPWFRNFGFNAGASVDPDHFKIQVLDQKAKERGDTITRCTLQVQRPRLNPAGQIERWEDLTDPGTSLVDLECQHVGDDNSPWFRSRYLRLLVERDDQNNRVADNVDTGADLSSQTLVAQLPTDDRRLEVLDLRVHGFKDIEECGATGAEPKCRAHAFADIGKSELALKIKVVRVDGPGAQAAQVTSDEIHDTMLRNLRLQLAQTNIGLQILSVVTVPPPQNMITVGDNQVVKASGGETIGATVALATGNVTATITTDKKDTPDETAARLAQALRAKGVRVRVSNNAPPRGSGDDFGPADILCFNPDGSPARVLGVTNAAGERQKLNHSGNWSNNAVDPGDIQYGANEPQFRLIGSRDFRALLKNHFEGTDRFHAYVVNNFAQANPGFTLLGQALIPYSQVDSRIRPKPAFTMGVLVSALGARKKTTLMHEGGHVLLDAIHTTTAVTGGPDTDWQGNANNARLGFSEIMCRLDSSGPTNAPVPFLHKRFSDSPLTVEFEVPVGDMNSSKVVFGSPPNSSTTRRFRELFSSVYVNLRQLRPAPGSNL